MKYYDRQTSTIIEETEYRKKTLEFLYNTKPGRVLLKLFVAKPWFSKMCSKYQKSKLSQKDILPFIEKYHVRENKEYAKKTYTCFNDFFTRQNTIIVRNDTPKTLVAPADSKMRVYKIDKNTCFNIKKSVYDIKTLLQDTSIANEFANGVCLVFRLAVNDCHRYYFIDNGKIVFHKTIQGELHTIRPISEKYNVFTRNSREVTIMDTESLGRIVYVEIGALLVGKIHNHDKEEFKKFDEKGYFEFGGSTIVVLLNKDIVFDEDIMKMNSENTEIKVSAGEKIGVVV